MSESSSVKLSEYAGVYGKSVEKVVNEAVELWWEQVAEHSIHVARKTGKAKKGKSRRKPVLTIPGPRIVVQHKRAVNE